ncbi:uncharacterized protein LOC125778115 [Bactrocera dorsalis]|uniref:Uncharacterized protein LOC125778115 n=1 Tax=Bactrocera dorsalis TaxID=27457 RepID=A0ABM3JML2_BACDO|nr:uncharacterized protein LOC125778115 [Bactrocera dorsalis]
MSCGYEVVIFFGYHAHILGVFSCSCKIADCKNTTPKYTRARERPLENLPCKTEVTDCTNTLKHFQLFTNTVTFSGIFNGMGEYVREANTQYFKKNKRKAQFILDFKERKRKRLTRRKRNRLDHW